MAAEIQTEPRPALRAKPASPKHSAEKNGTPEDAGRAQPDGATPDAAATPVTKTQAPRRRSRHGWRSPLTRRILLLNLLVLVIPVLGLMHLEQYRNSLIAAELDGLRTQARSFALSLGSTAVVANTVGVERLLPELTRHLMRLLLASSSVRARVFALDSRLIADSFVLMGPGGQVTVVELPAPEDSRLSGWLISLYDRMTDWLPGPGELPRYREAAEQFATDYEEAKRALTGESGGAVRPRTAPRSVRRCATGGATSWSCSVWLSP